MARKILGFVLILAALAALPAVAQLIGRTATVTTLPGCNGTKQMALVTDATNATTLGAGGGNASVWVSCASGSWAIEEVAAVSDLSGYLPVSGTVAAAIAVGQSGAGNDIGFTAIDNFTADGNDWLFTAVATGGLVAPVMACTATTSFTVTSPVSLFTSSTSFTVTSPVQLQTATTSATVTSPVQVNTASTSILNTTPKFSVSGNYEYSVATVTVADDAAGTKPAGVITILTDIVLGACNDATGSTLTITEPTVTSGYGRRLTLISTGTGNCELADSAGVLELSGALVLEPNSTLSLVYANAAWHQVATTDNVP